MRLFLSLLLCVLIPFCIKAQAPVADFSASVVSGCSPLSVSFTDKSTGAPKSWNWDFGNGQLSNQQNPTATFNPGTYTITLVVRNNDGINSMTKSKYIVSNPSPSASFSADKNISCLPGNIQFRDQSVANAGTINKWEWLLGDGTASGAQNPSHNYTAAGYYDVYLKVTSSTGCSNATSIGRYIRIVNGVKADFSPVGPSSCKAPFNLTYKNLTSGPGNLSYAWDLGNGTSSAQVSPAATYAAAGSYTVKLTASSNLGCSDTITKTIPINGITTSFTTNKDSVCLGSPVVFQNTTSSPAVKVLWNLGDGTSSTLQVPPPKTYASPGSYPVTLYSSFPGCSDSAKKTIYVFGKPAVDFYSSNNNSFCKAPAAVSFQNTSPNVASANWDFGDGSTLSSAAPLVTHTYTQTGNFTVSLTVTDSRGCSNTITKAGYVNILGPVVNITNVPGGVCVGQPYTATVNIGSVDGVASVTWDFGDGTPPSVSPTHTYIKTGSYTLSVTVLTKGGCTATKSVPNAVTVSTPPTVDFSKSGDSVCRSGTVAFTNLSSPIIPNTTTYLWDFNDGGKSTLKDPQHTFSDTGAFTITLQVTNNGCSNTLSKAAFVHVLPPLANFGYRVPDCNNRSNVVFTDSSKNNTAYGPLSWSWTFGDGGPGATIQNPVHTYPPITAYNPYTVTLVVKNNKCSDTLTRTVKLYNDSARFVMDKQAYCRNEQVTFTTINNLDYLRVFNWIVDGVSFPTDQGTYYVRYDTSGSHTVQLVTTDVNGCKNESAIKTFSVAGPRAKFTKNSKGGCSNSTITFTDASVSTGTITKWVFDFGDGSPAQTFTAPPFTHKFAATGNYRVKLTVYDNVSTGCSDSYTDSVLITKPVANFSTDTTTFCPGTPMSFKDSSVGGPFTYLWSFGDGLKDTVQNPRHAYPKKDSVYSVKLVVTDSVGCTDSLLRSNYVNIRSPKPLYTVQDTATLCPPLETKFHYKGTDAASFSWDFGDGGSSIRPDPNHFYNNYGKYTAKLYVTGYGGCVDSAGINITLTDPIAATAVSFSPNPAQACNNITVNFSITPPYSSRFKFYFGDGQVDSSQKTSITHSYTLPNLYWPYVFLADNVGCQVVKGGIGKIDVLGAVPLFGMDKKKFCDTGNVYFTDYSQDGHDSITTRTWSFGDGTAPVVLPKDATHRYAQPGLFVPMLTVTTKSGCKQQFTDTVRVLATPQPVITSEATICKDRPISFAGSLLVPPDTAITWNWDLSGGRTSSLQKIPVTYADTGLHHITLRATNSLGCKGDTSKNITVFPLPAIRVTGDTTMLSGGSGVPIPLSYSSNATTFNWTPADNLSCTNCANPVAKPKYTTTYHVQVTDANGCTSSRNVTIIVACNNKNFFVPNTFSPNNDGNNDRFYPRGTGLYLIQSMRIFNRWGEMIFEKRNFPANDAASGWDGTYKGKPASSDTYIFMVDIICDNATVITTKGNITLIR